MPVFQLIDEIVFPPTEFAEPNGLLAIGGDLSPSRLLAAYREGIFPWYNEGEPILWWSTDPRLVIIPEEFHIPKRLTRYQRKITLEIRFDSDFPQVIEQCANINTENRKDTWILPEIKEAYTKLHHLGYAHSVECWQNEKLVGGLYGIALDKIFFGESMFSLISSGSQFALIALMKFLTSKEFLLVDCQMTTEHLLRFGAKELNRKRFNRFLQRGISTIQPQDWVTS